MSRGYFVGRLPQLSSDRTAIIERGMAHVRFSKGVLLNGSDGSFASGSGRPPLQAMSVMPRKRRSATKMRSVAMGQLRTHAPQQTADYSITSSARSDGGIINPMALAVLRVISSS